MIPDANPLAVDMALRGIAPTPIRDPIPAALAFHRWRAERGRFREDLGPVESCRACGGRHAFRVACALIIDTLERRP